MAQAGIDLYNKVKYMSVAEKKKVFKTISPDVKAEYKKHLNRLKQATFRMNNKETANKRATDRMKELRAENPDKYRKMNVVHNKTYRGKKDESKNENTGIAKDILNDIVNDVLNKVENKPKKVKLVNLDVIDLIQKKADKEAEKIKKREKKLEEGRLRVKMWRAKKKEAAAAGAK